MRLLYIFLFAMIAIPNFAQQKAIIADGAELVLVNSEFEFTEGPAVAPNGNVFFTDQPNDRILEWSAADNTISVFMENAGRANGLYFDHQGNLIACADEHSELWQIDQNKNVVPLIKDYRGQRLNGPNDLWIDPEGGIYFTDPFYRRPYWEHSEKEIESERVYYLSPDGLDFRFVADDLVKPNGIIGTPDGKTLYVADIGDGKTWSYSIAEDGSLGDKTLFTNSGSDGMTIDNQGNVYLTGDGVMVFNKEGKQIEHIPVERDWTANVTFGGKDEQILFITAMNSVFTIEMDVNGVRY